VHERNRHDEYEKSDHDGAEIGLVVGADRHTSLTHLDPATAHGAPSSPRTGCSRPTLRQRAARAGRIAVAVATIAAAAACASDRAAPPDTALTDDAITVGSFDFAESVVVAEVYSQGLEAAGYKVIRAFGLGPREFVGPALMSGLVEFVPEYAGTAAEFHSLGRAVPTDDVATTHAELASAVSGAPIRALAGAPAQDANTFVVTTATAARLHLSKLSDLEPVAGELTLGGPPECPVRPQCEAGLTAVYGLHFHDFLVLDAGGPLTHQALREQLVDVALLFTTDPTIADQGLVELVDDRRLQPAENITPLVRTEIVDRWGDAVVATIDGVSARLTTAAVRELNLAALRPDADTHAIAAAWWSEVGS
jgi:osmoprotectant transport system substrate-binding protein